LSQDKRLSSLFLNARVPMFDISRPLFPLSPEAIRALLAEASESLPVAAAAS